MEDSRTGRIREICISEKRGTEKHPVDSARLIKDWGIEGDAHAGKWHRQVSLLAYEQIEAFRQRGAEVEPGAFGENLIVEGFDLKQIPIGSRMRCGSVLLKLMQIGKECHSRCRIFEKMGECIMPTEGVFAVVLEGGVIRPGDEVILLEQEGSDGADV